MRWSREQRLVERFPNIDWDRAETIAAAARFDPHSRLQPCGAALSLQAPEQPCRFSHGAS